MTQIKHIREFGTIWNAIDFEETTDSFDRIFLDDKSFINLKNFVAENTDSNNEIEAAFSYHRSKGRDYIKVKNHVGVIETRNNTSIEILPKIYSSKNNDHITSRLILLKMLRCLKDSPFKTIDQAQLKSAKMPLLEIFISLFLDEIEGIIQRGIKHYYNSIEANQKYLKGRLIFSNQIKLNAVRSDRFYVKFDEFLVNIPQNRILKSALVYLNKKSKVPKNKRRIIDFLAIFQDIDISKSLSSDFNKIDLTNRLNSYYTKAIKWAKLFLDEESFCSYRGKHLNTALLFPMEVLFEAYVANRIKKQHPEYSVSTQDRKHYLLTDLNLNRKKFRIRPDIVLRKEDELIVIDTKWKILDENQPGKNYLISQADMYQLYAYGKKYDTTKLVLIYPHCNSFTGCLKFNYDETINLECIPWIFDKQTAFSFQSNKTL